MTDHEAFLDELVLQELYKLESKPPCDPDELREYGRTEKGNPDDA